jgi:hypothetical protein
VVWVNIPSDVPHATVIPDFVEGGEHTRDQYLEAAWNMVLLVLLKLSARSNEVAGLGWLIRVRLLRMAIEDCINDLAKQSATQLGWPPALLQKILD